MKIEEKLQTMKRSYQATHVSRGTIDQTWQELETHLTPQQQRIPRQYYLIGFVCMLFLLGGGLVMVSQAATPGQPLYPVRSFSQSALQVITGQSPHAQLQHLAHPSPSSSHLQHAVVTVTPAPSPSATPEPSAVKGMETTAEPEIQKHEEIENHEALNPMDTPQTQNDKEKHDQSDNHSEGNSAQENKGATQSQSSGKSSSDHNPHR